MTVHFDITIEAEVVHRLGCAHLPQTDWEWLECSLKCRACSIMDASRQYGRDGDLELSSMRNTTTDQRRLSGTAHSDRARLWVSRVLAFAQFHRDPIELMLTHNRQAELDAMGAFVPTWAQAAVYLRKQLAQEQVQANT